LELNSVLGCIVFPQNDMSKSNPSTSEYDSIRNRFFMEEIKLE
jgi:hypothetical protein